MPSNPPVDFEQRAKRPKGASGNDYPYAIKGRELMENFVFATLDMDESLYEERAGVGGHPQRYLKIPRIPNNGTYVLGSNGGNFIWIPTDEC